MQEQIFYYKFSKLNLVFILNLILSAALIYGFDVVFFQDCLFLLKIAAVFCGLAWVIWFWKSFFPHKAIVIYEDGIRIDHCQKLKWQDIDHIEYKDIKCCFATRKVLSLVPKNETDIKLNMMQKGRNPFPPFSIPLYGILKKSDEDEIIRIVTSKVYVAEK